MSGRRSARMRGRRRLTLAVLSAPLLSACAKQGITPKAHEVHDLYRIIFSLAVPVFLAVEGLLLWNVIRYRKRDDSPAPQTEGGPGTLAGFFAIGAVIIAVLYPFGERALSKVDHIQGNPQVDLRLE